MDELEGGLLPEEVARQVIRLHTLPHRKQSLELGLRLARQRASVKLRVEAAPVRWFDDGTASGLREAGLLGRLLPPGGRDTQRHASALSARKATRLTADATEYDKILYPGS